MSQPVKREAIPLLAVLEAEASPLCWPFSRRRLHHCVGRSPGGGFTTVLAVLQAEASPLCWPFSRRRLHHCVGRSGGTGFTTVLAVLEAQASPLCWPFWRHRLHHYVGRSPGADFTTVSQMQRLKKRFVCFLVGCLTSQQHASVSQGRVCTDNFTCCHTEIQVADQTFYLTQLQYTYTRPTSPSADPMMPGEWQGRHWNANF